jgi:hypothetical protein
MGCSASVAPSVVTAAAVKRRVGDELKILLVGADSEEDNWFQCEVVLVTQTGFLVTQPMAVRHTTAFNGLKTVMKTEHPWSKRVYATIEAIVKENKSFTREDYKARITTLELDKRFAVGGYGASAMYDQPAAGAVENIATRTAYHHKGLVEFNRKGGGGTDRSYLLLTQYCRTYRSLLNAQGVWLVNGTSGSDTIRIIGTSIEPVVDAHAISIRKIVCLKHRLDLAFALK